MESKPTPKGYLWKCEDVHLETQPLEKNRGLIPGRLFLLDGPNSEKELQWQPAIESGYEFHCQILVNSIVTVKKRRGPDVSFVLARGTSVGPFTFPSEDSYEQLLRRLAELGAIDPSSLQKPTTASDWLTTSFSNFYGSFKKSVKELVRDDSIEHRPTFLPPNSSDGRNVHRLEEAESSDTMVVCRGTTEAELGDFDILDMANSLPERKHVKREAPVSLDEFKSFFQNGNLVREVDLRERVFRGGLSPKARANGWRFFLNFNTHDKEFVRRSKEQYMMLKQQWESILPVQIENNKLLREQLAIIEKDVERTDRLHPVFADLEGEGIRSLSNVLKSWLFYNWDLGYVQGMSDLVAMLYVVLEDEIETFWCFVHWMEKASSNFDHTQSGIIGQLAHLARLVKYVDPELMAHLEEQSSDHFYFFFRWLIVFFKREFSFEDTMTIWEACWTEFLTPDLPIFICAAVILSLRDRILNEDMHYDDILKAFNELSSNLSADSVLCDAESILIQLSECKSGEVPSSLVTLLRSWTDRFETTLSRADESTQAADECALGGVGGKDHQDSEDGDCERSEGDNIRMPENTIENVHKENGSDKNMDMKA